MRRKIKRIISWTVFIFPICLLTGIAIYLFREQKMVEDENITEQTEMKPVETSVTKTEKAPDVPEDSETPADLDSDFMEETPFESVPEKPEEGNTAETGEKKELGSIYIPVTKSLFSASDVSMDAFQNRITQSEASVRGKIYYQGENGLLESFLSVDEKGVIHEILFSYDPAGNPVDRMEIGLLAPDNTEKKYATLSVNKLSVFELTASEAAGKRQERVTEYFITPQLRFKKGRTFSKLL